MSVEIHPFSDHMLHCKFLHLLSADNGIHSTLFVNYADHETVAFTCLLSPPQDLSVQAWAIPIAIAPTAVLPKHHFGEETLRGNTYATPVVCTIGLTAPIEMAHQRKRYGDLL